LGFFWCSNRDCEKKEKITALVLAKNGIMKAVWKWTREGNVELNKRKEIKQFSNFESSVKGNFVLVIKGIMSWIHNLKCSLHTLKHKPNTINVLLIKLLSTNLVPYNITKKS